MTITLEAEASKVTSALVDLMDANSQGGYLDSEMNAVTGAITKLIEHVCRLPSGDAQPPDLEGEALTAAMEAELHVWPPSTKALWAAIKHVKAKAAAAQGAPEPAIYSTRAAITETDLPPGMSSADAIRELWRRLEVATAPKCGLCDDTGFVARGRAAKLIRVPCLEGCRPPGGADLGDLRDLVRRFKDTAARSPNYAVWLEAAGLLVDVIEASEGAAHPPTQEAVRSHLDREGAAPPQPPAGKFDTVHIGVGRGVTVSQGNTVTEPSRVPDAPGLWLRVTPDVCGGVSEYAEDVYKRPDGFYYRSYEQNGASHEHPVSESCWLGRLVLESKRAEKAANLHEQVKAAVDRARTTLRPDMPREIEKRLLTDLYAALCEAKS